MATITIEIDIDADGNTTVIPNPAAVGDGDTVRWHVNSNAHGSGALSVGLPPGADSPFGNTDNRLEVGVEMPRRCNLLEPAPEPVNWPAGVNSYSYNVEFSGSPIISAVSGTLVKRETPRIEYPDFPDDIRKVYLLPPNPVIGRQALLSCYTKIYPVSWWKRWCHWRWPFRYHKQDCCSCCCCCDKHAPSPVVLPPPPNVIAAPTIVLSQAMLPTGGLFYLLITHRGDRCQFVVQWAAAGGVGQLTVDLDVQDPSSTSFRRLASGLGPTDQYTFVGDRDTYLFRATVIDSRGQSTFDTLSVTCP
jgi:hypothetical protein